MKAEKLFEIVQDRGLKIMVRDGTPIVCGDKERMTPALIETLKAHRSEILEYLGLGITPVKPITHDKEPDTECFWPGNEYIGPLYFPELGYPVGAYFYRKIGETDWSAIPGRTWDAETKRGTIEKKKA